MKTEHLDSSHSQKSEGERKKKNQFTYIHTKNFTYCAKRRLYGYPTGLGSIKTVHFTTLAPVLRDEEIQRPMIMGTDEATHALAPVKSLVFEVCGSCGCLLPGPAVAHEVAGLEV